LTWRSDSKYSSVVRQPSLYKPLETYALEKEKHYQQQFADMYFLRLAKLKPIVEQNAREAWDGFQIAGEMVEQVERVLDVRQGKLCWVSGTIYMDMPLKPNILDDISKDVSNCNTECVTGRINTGYSTGFQRHSPHKSICRHLEKI
jgi:DNA polymerase delta subunit 2